MAISRSIPGAPNYIRSTPPIPEDQVVKLMGRLSLIRSVTRRMFELDVVDAPEDGSAAVLLPHGVEVVRPWPDNQFTEPPTAGLRKVLENQDGMKAVAWNFPELPFPVFGLPPATSHLYRAELFRAEDEVEGGHPVLAVEWTERNHGSTGNEFIVDGSAVDMQLLMRALRCKKTVSGSITLFRGRSWIQERRDPRQRISLEQAQSLRLKYIRVTTSKMADSIESSANEAHPTPEIALAPTSALLGRLVTCQEILEGTREEMNQIVQRAREQNVTWAAIGEALGIRGETAYQRFSAVGRESHRKKVARQRESAKKAE